MTLAGGAGLSPQGHQSAASSLDSLIPSGQNVTSFIKTIYCAPENCFCFYFGKDIRAYLDFRVKLVPNLFFFLFCPHHTSCGILVSLTRGCTQIPAVKMPGSNHWTARAFLVLYPESLNPVSMPEQQESGSGFLG